MVIVFMACESADTESFFNAKQASSLQTKLSVMLEYNNELYDFFLIFLIFNVLPFSYCLVFTNPG